MLEEDYKTQHSWNIRKSSMTAVSNELNLILHLRPTSVAVHYYPESIITIWRALILHSVPLCHCKSNRSALESEVGYKQSVCMPAG